MYSGESVGVLRLKLENQPHLTPTICIYKNLVKRQLKRILSKKIECSSL